MAELVEAVLRVRRGARASLGHFVAFAIAALVVLGLCGPQVTLRIEHAVVAGAWSVVLIARLFGKPRSVRRAAGEGLDLDVGLLLLVATHALVQHLGGLQSSVYPIVYVLIAAVTAFTDRKVGRVWLALAVTLEAAIYFVTEGRTDLEAFGLRAALIVLFGVLHGVFVQSEVRSARRRSDRELRDERERVREDVRLFRLVATPTDAARVDDERLSRSSIEEVRQALHFNLDVLKGTMGLHTCVLLMQDSEGSALRIVELVTDSELVAEGPFPLGAAACP